MCSTSSTPWTAPEISYERGLEIKNLSPNQLRILLAAGEEKIKLIDVREASEFNAPDSTHVTDNSVNIPLGSLLHYADSRQMGSVLEGFSEDQQREYLLVVFCRSGYRGGIAATQLLAKGYRANNLESGVNGWVNPAALNPSFLVTIATQDPEKVTLGLSLANAALVGGDTVAVVFMSDSVILLTKTDPEKDQSLLEQSISLSAPFKSASELYQGLVKKGGLVFACKTCVEHAGLSYDQLVSSVSHFQAPDLVRMIKNAKGSVQYS